MTESLATRLKTLEAEAVTISEEDTLRHYFVEAVNQFAHGAGLPPEVRAVLNQRLIRGKPDARLGGLVFEVKLPKPKGDGIEAAIRQAKGYLDEFPRRYGGKRARGIAYDGLSVALIDESGHVLGRGHASRLANRVESWVLSLGGAIISPEDFVSRLGPGSPLATDFTREIWASFQEYRGQVQFIDEVYRVWQGLYGVATNLNAEAVRGLTRAAGRMDLQITGKARAEEYLFVAQTYLALLLKLLVARVAAQVRLTEVASVGSLLGQHQPVFALERLESSIHGLRGVFEEDVFLWPVEAARHSAHAQSRIDDCLKTMASTVDDLDLVGVSSDFLRLVYQQFFDASARRALGEFYTSPDLVDETLTAAGFEGDASHKIADITCGSGTFLVRAIRRIIDANRQTEPDELLTAITQNVVGVDIHPFAVAMARVNYILAVADLLSDGHPVSIPILWGDSLLRVTPTTPTMPTVKPIKVTIPNLETFELPNPEVVDWRPFLDNVRQTVGLFRPPMSFDVVWKRLRENVSPDEYLAYEDTIKVFVRRIVDRENAGSDCRWLPLLRNALGIEELKSSCDFVVGNPPWVRIHNISPEIRERLFDTYVVCMSAGWARGAKLGGSTRGFGRQIDYSMAFVERGMEFLKPNGRLGFVITSKIMHALYASGLRKKLLEETQLRYLADYSLFAKPLFQDATNYPLILALEMHPPQKDHRVPVTVTGPTGHAIRFESRQSALPILPYDPESPWALVTPPVRAAFDRMLAAPREHPEAPWRLRRLLGETQKHRPRMGVKTALNAVFLVKRALPTERQDELQVFAEGYHSPRVAPSRREKYVARVEKNLLRPLVRGDSIDAWRFHAEDFILWTHDDVTGRPVEDLPPSAKAYFDLHSEALRKRSDYRDGMPIWQIFRVAPDKLKEKVAWQELSHTLQAVRLPRSISVDLLGREALLVPLQTVYFIPVDDPDTALDLAAWLNSTPVRVFAASFAERARGAYFRHIAWVTGLLPLPEDLQHRIEAPQDTPMSGALVQLRRLSDELHRDPTDPERDAKQSDIDSLVASLYGLTTPDLEALTDYAAFIRGARPDRHSGSPE